MPDILVIEDDRDIAEGLVALFRMEGYSATSVSNGLSALAYLKQAAPRLIVLDLSMPIMGGAEFRKKQLSDPRISAIPVVVLTADGQAGNAHSYSAAVVSKSADFSGLLAVIRRVLPIAR